jgi:hypothetical protein
VVGMAHPWAQADLASTVLPMQRVSSSRGLTGYLDHNSFFGGFTADNETTPSAVQR